MAVSKGKLEELQTLLVDSLVQRLEADTNDGIPTDAATLGVIAKLLKDNAITVDPQDKDSLSELRDSLNARASARRKRAEVLELVKADMTKVG